MLIPPAFAETSIDNTSNIATFLPQILVFIGMFAFFYFSIWRPHSKRQQEKQALLKALQVGDVVYTSGGIVGKITKLHANFFQIEVNTTTRIYIQQEAVVDLIPTGSLKTLGFE